MAEFDITNDATGETITVSGDVAPTAEDAAAIFASRVPVIDTPTAPIQATQPVAPPTALQQAGNVAMEAVAGFNRPMAAVADFAMTPVRAVRQAVTGRDTTLSSGVAQRGDFAGPGLATDTASATGEIASSAGIIGGVTRLTSRAIQEMTVYGESTIAKVLEQMGRTKPAQEIIAGGFSGAGGELSGEAAAAAFGEDYRQAGQIAGQLIAPTAWFAATDRIVAAVNAGAPSTDKIRGGARALYTMLEDAGLKANGPSQAMMRKQITDFIEEQGLSPATTTGPLKTKLTQLLKDVEDGNVTYKMLDEVHGVLNGLGKSGDTLGTQSASAARMLDDMIINMEVDDTAAIGGRSVKDVITEARGLWRRASVAQTMDETLEKALLSTDASRGDFVKHYRRELAKLLSKTNKEGKYFTEAERAGIRQAVRGGSLERTLEAVSNAVGFNSNDLMRSVVVSSVFGGAGFAAAGPTGAGLAIAGSTALAGALRLKANSLFKNNASYLRSIIKAGPNARDIAAAYRRYTPRDQRNAGDLASLFVSNGASVDVLRTQGPTTGILADAVFLAAGAENVMNSKREEEANQPPPSP